jgi:PAS domain S-box-containing protein
MDDNLENAVSEMSEGEAMATFSRSSIAMVISNPDLPDNPLVYVNRAFEILTGYSAEAAIGRNCRFLQGADTDPADIEKLRRAVAAGEDVSVVLNNYRADGTMFRNAVVITPLRDDTDAIEYYLGIQRKLTDAEADDLDRIEGLLTEIQHRVKNHLSMIVGLIRMQAREKSAMGDFDALSRRVESLQLLYEEMTAAQRRSNGDTIDLGSYLSRITNTIAHIDGRPGVRVNIDTEPMEATIERAVQIGLIVSELVTNALKHGFGGRDDGLVEVRATRVSQNSVRIIVSDDGVGLTENDESGGLGSRIVQRLVEGVAGGLTYATSDVGTVAVLDIPKRAAEPLKDI